MELIGYFSIFILYICLLIYVLTGTRSWLLLWIWCAPLFGMAYLAPPQTEINGLIVVICSAMIFFYAYSLRGLKMWNIRNRVINRPVRAAVYVVSFLLFYYCYHQAQLLGYLFDFQGLRGENNIWKVISVIPFFFVNVPLTEMLINGIDRFFSIKSSFVLLKCTVFVANDFGGQAKTMLKGRYLDGVNNGRIFHFRLTHKTYLLLKKVETIVIPLKRGFFGGLYVLDYPKDYNREKAQKINRWLFWRGFFITVCFLIVLGAVLLTQNIVLKP